MAVDLEDKSAAFFIATRKENWLKTLDGVASYEILNVPENNNPLNFTNGVEYVDLGLLVIQVY